MSAEHISIRLQTDESGKTNLSEQDIVQIATPTSAPWKEVFDSVLMPREVRGLRILDVGAGASSATRRLLELGADAYAIDPRYNDISELIDKVKNQNRHLAEDAPKTVIGRNEALKRFVESLRRSPSRYVAASATSLPFRNQTFDLVFSRNTITSYLDIDSEVFSSATNECLRVAKSEGSVRLFPYLDEEPTWPDEVNYLRLYNEQRVVENLKNDPAIEKISEEVVTIRGRKWLSLIIQKAG